MMICQWIVDLDGFVVRNEVVLALCQVTMQSDVQVLYRHKGGISVHSPRN